MSRLAVVGVLCSGIAIGWFLRAGLGPGSQTVPAVSTPSETSESSETPVVESLHALTESPQLTAAQLLPVEASQNRIDDLQQLLQSAQDDAAMALFIEQHDAVQRDLWRHLIVNEAQNRATQGNLDAATTLLKQLVDQLPLAVNERVVLANLYQQQKLPYQQLSLLFDALGIAATSDDLTRLDFQIEQGVRAAITHFGNDVDARIQFYRYLIQQRAAHTPYYIDLARLLIDAAYLDAAAEQLVIVQHDPVVGEKARQMLVKIEQLRLEALETPVMLQRRGNHFVVNALLGHHDATLLIDTGASMTVLSRRAASVLGLDEQEIRQRVTVNTANGETEALVYQLVSMTIGPFRVAPIDIAVVDRLEMNGASGLLGMNFLQQFEFRIDQQNSQLFLKYRE